MSHTPFRVTLELTGPMVVPDHPILLDSVLEELAAEAQQYRCARPCALPLARRHPDGEPAQWVYAASAFRLPVADVAGRTMARRCNLDEIARDADSRVVKLGTLPAGGTGAWRNYLLPYDLQALAGPAIAYGVGDIDAVAELLSRMTHFGPKRRLGHGVIHILSVDPCDDDRAWEFRPVPWEVDGHAPITAAVRPPYWSRQDQCRAFVPMDLYA